MPTRRASKAPPSPNLDPEHISALLENGESGRASELLEAALEHTPHSTRLKLIKARLDLKDAQRAPGCGQLLLRYRSSQAGDPLYQALHRAAQEMIQLLLNDAGEHIRRDQMRTLETKLEHAAHLCQHDSLLTLVIAEKLLLGAQPPRDDHNLPSFMRRPLRSDDSDGGGQRAATVNKSDEPEYILSLNVKPSAAALAAKYAQLALDRAGDDADTRAQIILPLFQILIVGNELDQAVTLLEANPSLRKHAPKSLARISKLLPDDHIRRITRMLRLGQWGAVQAVLDAAGQRALPAWFSGLAYAEIALHNAEPQKALRILKEAVNAPEQPATSAVQIDILLALHASLQAQRVVEQCPACKNPLPSGADECGFCEAAVSDTVLRMDVPGGEHWRDARARWLLAGLASEAGEYERALAELDLIAPLIDSPDHDVFSPYNALRIYVETRLNEAYEIRRLKMLITSDVLTGAHMEAVRRELASQNAPWTQIPLRLRRQFIQRALEAGYILEAQSLLERAFGDVAKRHTLNPLRKAVQAATIAAVQRCIEHSVSALQQADIETAVTAARRACQLNPDDLQALHARARALHAAGDDIRALNDFRQVAERAASPELRAEMQIEIARLLAANQLISEAIEELTDLAQPEALALRERLDRSMHSRPALAVERRRDAVMYDTLTREADVPLVHATFAIVLRATSRPWGGEAEWFDSVLGSQFRFVQMLGGLIAHEGDPVFGLRVICAPQPEAPERGRLTFALLARVAANGEAQARALANQLYHDLLPALPAQDSHAFQFEPVSDEEELARLLEPFEATTFSEILRREQGSPEDGTHAIYPYLPTELNLHALCWALLRQPAPTMISLHLQPTVLYAWEIEYLGRNLTVDSPQAGMLMQATSAQGNAWQTVQRMASTQVNLNRLSRLNARAFLLQVNAASAGSVSPLFAQSAAATLFGALQQAGGAFYGGWEVQTAVTDAERAAARRNCNELEMERWTTSHTERLPTRLRYLVSEMEAIFAFRLPIPLRDGLPGVKQLDAKPILPPPGIPTYGTVYGESVAQVGGRTTRIRQSNDDRRRHVFVPGRTGTGKSTLLSQMALQDIANGKGVCVVDPHGDLINDVLMHIPASRADDVIIFDAADEERPIGLNLLEHTSESEKQRIVTEFIGSLMRMYDPGQIGIVGPRFEHNVRMAMLTAMVVPGNTLIEVVRVLSNSRYAKSLAALVTDPVVRMYWGDQIGSTSDYHKSEILDHLVSKFNRYVGDKLVRNIIGQRRTTLNFREIMDRQKILLVSLSKGLVGVENAQFLGLMLLQRLLITALERANVSPDQRPDFALYVDEFQNFATPLFSTILSEGRKYGLMATLANQYLTQLDAKVRSAIFGNVGTLVSFQLGSEDAQIFSSEMYPALDAADLINLPRYTAAVKLLVNGSTGSPFTMRTLPLLQSATPALAEQIRQASRERYGRDVTAVSKEIEERFEKLLR